MLQANNLLLSKGASEASWAVPAFLIFLYRLWISGVYISLAKLFCLFIYMQYSHSRDSRIWEAFQCLSCTCRYPHIAPFSLANIDFPMQAMFAQGGFTFQGHPSCPPQRKENHLLDIVALIRGKADLPTYVIIYPVFSTVLPFMAQHEWNMFHLILIIFFRYLKSQMLRWFTLIKLQ